MSENFSLSEEELDERSDKENNQSISGLVYFKDKIQKMLENAKKIDFEKFDRDESFKNQLNEINREISIRLENSDYCEFKTEFENILSNLSKIQDKFKLYEKFRIIKINKKLDEYIDIVKDGKSVKIDKEDIDCLYEEFASMKVDNIERKKLEKDLNYLENIILNKSKVEYPVIVNKINFILDTFKDDIGTKISASDYGLLKRISENYADYIITE